MKLNVPTYEKVILVDPYSEEAPLKFNYRKDNGTLKSAASKVNIDLGQKTTLIVCSEKLLTKEVTTDTDTGIEELLSASFIGLSPAAVYASVTSNAMSIVQREVLDAYLAQWFEKLPVVQNVFFLRSDLETIHGSLEHVMERLPEWSAHNIDSLKTAVEAHSRKSQQSKKLLIGASVLMFIVAGTRITSGYLQSKIQELQLVQGQSEQVVQELMTKNETLDLRLAQLRSLGINGNPDIVRLGQSVLEDVPGSITLHELHIKPLELKGEGMQQEVLYEKDRIMVKGDTRSSFDLNKWVKQLKQQGDFQEIDVTYQMKKNSAVFELTIKLHG